MGRESARREAGYQLDKVQNRQAPTDWKPIAMVGKGVQELCAIIAVSIFFFVMGADYD